MWSIFFLSVLVCAIIFFLPTSFFLRSLKLPWLTSISCAPIVAIVAYSIEAIAFEKLSIWCNFWSLFLPVLAFSCLFFLASLIRKKRHSMGNSLNAPEEKEELLGLVCFIVFALIIGLIYYVKPLDGPSCFSQAWDDFTHYSLIQSFIDTGVYSTLTTSIYANLGIAGSYYPAGWHLICAMTETALGTDNALASNAVNYVIACAVYPSGCALLIGTLFPKERKYLIAGALLSVAFIAFPWSFLIKGKIVSNMLGFSFIPSAVSLFVSATDREAEKRGTAAALFAVTILSAVFTQPNLAFSLMIILLPYCLCRIHTSLKEKGKRSFAALFCFIILFCLLWLALFKMPFLQGVVSYSAHQAYTDWTTAFIDIVTVSYARTPPQILLGLLTILGFVLCLKSKKTRWLCISYIILALMLLVSACENGPIRNLLAGFWYSDARRVAALLGIISMPIAVQGLAALSCWIAQLASNKKKLTAFIFSIGIILGIYYPYIPCNGLPEGYITSPFGYLNDAMDSVYSSVSGNNQFFSEDEQKFVEEAKTIVGNDLVENNPADGSSFAYGFNGLNVIHRHLENSCETLQYEKNLDENLNKIGTDQSIKEEASASQVKYVIQLDQGHDSPISWPAYKEATNTKGIDNINDESKGFAIVLSEGDMRLYRIDC